MNSTDDKLSQEQTADQVKSGRRGHWLTRTGPALVLLVLVSLAYNWYYLRGGFQAHDLVFLGLMKQDPLQYSRWLGMWAADHIPALMNLWWFEREGVSAFFRPLPSLIFEGSVRVLGERAFPLHLLSILVHGLVAGTLFLLVRRLTGKPWLALLAGVFFLSCEDHSTGVGFISMVTDLLCVLFINLALLAHAAWLEKRRAWLLAASLAALVPALLSKESAVVAPLGIALMTLLLPAGREAELDWGRAALRSRVRSFLKDWPSWVPALLMIVGYLALYRGLGFGGLSSGMYVDPFANPVRYLGHLVIHLPTMWLATLTPVPPSLPWFMSGLSVPFAVAGFVLFIVWLAALRPLRRSGLVLWAMALYILALLPQMATDASERALYFPAVAASIVLAILLVQIGFVARRLAPDRAPAPRLTRVAGWWVLVCVLVPGALLSAGYPFVYLRSLNRPSADALAALPYIEERDPAHVLILNTPGCFHTFYLQPAIEYGLGYPVDVHVLSSMNGVLSVERLDERDFVLHADRPGWLTNPFAAVLRSPGPPRQGKVFEEDLFTATLLTMSRDRRDVSAVRFHVRMPLSDPSLLVLMWDGEAFRPLDLTSMPAGEKVRLADTSDVWASMM